MITPIRWRINLGATRAGWVACVASVGMAILVTAPGTAGASRGPGRGPFASLAMRRFLASRHGNITAAVDDLTTGQEFVYRAGVR